MKIKELTLKLKLLSLELLRRLSEMEEIFVGKLGNKRNFICRYIICTLLTELSRLVNLNHRIFTHIKWLKNQIQ